MKKFVILPDVTCDLSEELRKRFDIEYIKGHIVSIFRVVNVNFFLSDPVLDYI